MKRKRNGFSFLKVREENEKFKKNILHFREEKEKLFLRGEREISRREIETHHHTCKKEWCGGDGFLKKPYKPLNLAENPKKMAENPITSKKSAGRISPDPSFFACMLITPVSRGEINF